MLAGGLGVGTLILCVLFALAFFLAFIGFQINRPVYVALHSTQRGLRVRLPCLPHLAPATPPPLPLARLMSLAGFGLFLLVLIIFAAIPKKDAVVCLSPLFLALGGHTP